ncbi:MAG: hypothetical protein JW939_08675 [Candidatus Thermoplasmatota archaeon]|nr:hypothetical protein [Candidatus Thermoplasmatota archaeon]
MGRRKDLYYGSFAVLLLVPVLIAANFYPGGVQAAPIYPLDPDVWVEVEHDEYDVNVEPETSEMLHVHGWVHCKTPPAFPPGETVIVHVDIGGTTILNDVFQYVFDRSTDVAEMNLEIVPILGASVELEILMRFIPNWYIDSIKRSGSGTEDQAVVHPLPYGAVHIRDPEKVTFSVGENKKIEVIVENNGNCEARVSMLIENEEGFRFAYPGLAFIIPERSFGIYPFYMEQTSGGGKEGKLHIKATSSVPGVLSSDEVDIEYETTGSIGNFFTGPIFLVSFLILAAIITAALVIILRRRQKKEVLRPH